MAEDLFCKLNYVNFALIEILFIIVFLQYEEGIERFYSSIIVFEYHCILHLLFGIRFHVEVQPKCPLP